MISIPVRVLLSHEPFEGDYDGFTGEGFAWNREYKDCDPTTEDCEPLYDWTEDRHDFIWFGVSAWFRGFDLFNLITFLPTAIVYTRLLRYHIGAAKNFLWMVKWWSHLGGWITSIANMTFAAFMMYDDLKDGVEGEDCSGYSRRRRRQCENNNEDGSTS